MIEYSAVTAVHTIWLVARAQGIGMGWVSILDPKAVAALLDVPTEWKFIGYFCLGYPQLDDTVPELEQMGWEARRSPSSVIFKREQGCRNPRLLCQNRARRLAFGLLTLN
jgi:5,6-dimethylbenzimidazole synthase